MDRYNIETLRRHGARARAALPERRVRTSLFFESQSRIYLWVTDRNRCRCAHR